MPTPTENYGWPKPDEGGSAGSWGRMLNTIIDAIDGTLKTASDLAAGALQRAGGDMAGRLGVKTDDYVTVSKGNMTGAVELDLAAGRFFFGTATGNITFSFKNPPADGRAAFVMVEITNGGGRTVNWPSSVRWHAGAAPALTSTGTDLIALYTRDGGMTWRAGLAQQVPA